MVRKCHVHGRFHVQRERIPANGAAFQGATIDQMRLRNGLLLVLGDRFLFCVFLTKLSDLLFPDLAGMVNGVLSLFVWVLEWVFGLLDFHAVILRRLSSSARQVDFELRHYRKLLSLGVRT